MRHFKKQNSPSQDDHFYFLYRPPNAAYNDLKHDGLKLIDVYMFGGDGTEIDVYCASIVFERLFNNVVDEYMTFE